MPVIAQFYGIVIKMYFKAGKGEISDFRVSQWRLPITTAIWQ
jgi:hypothetical protein